MLLDLVDKLIDRLIQLANQRQEGRTRLLKDSVEPVYIALEAVHNEYLASFLRYREILKSSTEPLGPSHALLDTIRTDNLFKEHQRARILQLRDSLADPEASTFLKAVCAYLVDNRVGADPLGGYRGGQFANPQRWRRTFLEEVDAIFNERWQSVLDPNAAAPPLYGDQLSDALADACERAGIPSRDPRRADRLKAHFAVRALDETVSEMQDAFGRISAEFTRLSQSLRA